jgi:hypothetical protein
MDQEDLGKIDIWSSERTESCDESSLNAHSHSNKACDKEKFSNAQPVWHLVLLLLTTGGFYQFYWFYRNWKQLNDLLKLGWRPLLRTALLFVPLAKWIVVFWQFQDIRDFSKSVGIWKTFSLYFVFPAYFQLFGFHLVLPEPYDSIERLIISLLPLWSLVVVQRTLNAYWEKKQPGLTERMYFSRPEICFMLILPILVIYAILFPNDPYVHIQFEKFWI